MRYEGVDELEELRRKAALYDEAMKQEPVAWDNPENYPVQMVRLEGRPFPEKPRLLYARPIPQPDVRELVEQAFRDGFDWGEYSARAERVWGHGPTEDEAWARSGALADLAKWETKP